MLGVVDDDASSSASSREADIAFVSQRYEGSEFNIPSKLMNFMAYGLPVLAAVNPAGEVARIVRRGAGRLGRRLERRRRLPARARAVEQCPRRDPPSG